MIRAYSHTPLRLDRIVHPSPLSPNLADPAHASAEPGQLPLSPALASDDPSIVCLKYDSYV
jgi:hypothetical protein